MVTSGRAVGEVDARLQGWRVGGWEEAGSSPVNRVRQARKPPYRSRVSKGSNRF